MNGIQPSVAIDAQRETTRRSFLLESSGLRYSSPLLSALAQACAADDEILNLGSVARPGQPAGMLILLVAQYLLLQRPDSRLARYFPSLTDIPIPAKDAFPVFREFVLDRRQEVMDLVARRTINANLVERASCILPALQYAASLARDPLTLIEICCSAGLNLLFDQYYYDYGTAGRVGVDDCPLQLTCKVIGVSRPPIDRIPPIANRIGVDLVTVDPSNPLERLWLEAMLCPEWKAERVRLRAALSIRAAHDIRIIQGDALAVLPSLLSEIAGPVCVLHTYCMLQWSAASKSQLHRLLRAASQDRDVYQVGIEVPDRELPETIRARLTRRISAGIPLMEKSFPSQIHCTSYVKGNARTQMLGEGDGFGTWLDWYTLNE